MPTEAEKDILGISDTNDRYNNEFDQFKANNPTTESINSAKIDSKGAKSEAVRQHLKGGGLEYPINGRGLGSRMVFSAVKVIPPFTEQTLASGNIVDEIKDWEAEGFSKEDYYLMNDDVDRETNTRSNQNLKVRSIQGEKVTLFVPPSFLSTDNFDYSSPSLGVMGAGALQAIRNTGKIGDAITGAVSKGFEGATEIFNSGLATEGARALAARAGSSMGGTAGAVASLATGYAPNPNIRTTFNAAGVREFNFQFKMIPNSASESANIQNIIKFFRFHSYPDEKAIVGGVSGALEYPNLFQIKIQSKGDDDRYKHVGTPMKLCYCKTVSVTYNATSPVLHHDGSPTEVDLTLTFQEYRALTRDDIRNESEEQFYYYEGVKISEN